ncbi:hypothetical protein B9Z55_012528 [Caenorhabditis nigoni]|nr:hypothetical protein B9Z55_012528 [Caenorhabditis nigoni]
MNHRPSISSDRVEVKRESWISPDAFDDMEFASTSYPKSPTPIPQNRIVNEGPGSLSEAPRTLSQEVSTDAFVEYGIQQIHTTLPQTARTIGSALQTPENRSPEPEVDEPTSEQADQELAYHADIAQEQSAKAPVNCPQPEPVENSPRLAVLMDPASYAHSCAPADCHGHAPINLFSSIQSDEMDYATSSMATAPLNSVNPMRGSYIQVEGSNKAGGVDETVIRFFEYFHKKRKMEQKMKEAKSGDTSVDPSDAVKSPELKDPVQPASTQDDQAPSTHPDVVTQLEIKNPVSPGPATETEATELFLHEFRRDIKQEIGDLAPPVPVTEVVLSEQSHGVQNLEDPIDDERYEMEEGKTIPSHGASLDSDFLSRPQQDARSQERLLADLSRQMTAIQETLGAYLAATPRTQTPTKRKRSPSLEVSINDPSVSSPAVKRANHQEAVIFDRVEVQRVPEALRGVNEIQALTPERKAQLRQERMNMYDGWFKNTYLPFNHSIDYESWTRQQFEEFAVQFLPSDVVTALVKEKVDGSKLEKIRCKNKKLMGRLHVRSNGIFALDHWNLIKKNLNSIHSYRTRKEEEEVE